MGLNVAVLGATGAVGQEMLTILEERLSVFGHAEGTGGEMHGDRLRGMQSQHGRLRLQPLPLPARPPFLRVQPPRTVAEVRAWEIGSVDEWVNE